MACATFHAACPPRAKTNGANESAPAGHTPLMQNAFCSVVQRACKRKPGVTLRVEHTRPLTMSVLRLQLELVAVLLVRTKGRSR
jgi:hypothetical protein